MQGLKADLQTGKIEVQIPTCLTDTLTVEERRGIERCLTGGHAFIFLVTYSQSMPMFQDQGEEANEVLPAVSCAILHKQLDFPEPGKVSSVK